MRGKGVVELNAGTQTDTNRNKHRHTHWEIFVEQYVVAPAEVSTERVGDEELTAHEVVHEKLDARARGAVNEVLSAGGDGGVTVEGRGGLLGDFSGLGFCSGAKYNKL